MSYHPSRTPDASPGIFESRRFILRTLERVPSVPPRSGGGSVFIEAGVVHAAGCPGPKWRRHPGPDIKAGGYGVCRCGADELWDKWRDILRDLVVEAHLVPVEAEEAS